jgi:hypothetical protein
MTTLDNGFYLKKPVNFVCELCDFKCSYNKDYQRHVDTIKHKNNVLTTKNNENGPENPKKYECTGCKKSYSDRAGLWRHKKTCLLIEKHEIDKDELIITLLKQNAELIKGQQDMMVKISENGINNNNNNSSNSYNTTTNSHNKAFNLNFFLNETCKEAMNVSEFVESIKMELCDLERVGEKGYIEGISNIIIKNLKALDITKRPVHCTDKKRETVYIKDEDKWEKDEDKTKMHKLIKRVVSKNTKMFAKFKEAHPDCLTYHSKFSEQYNTIIYESMGGKGDDDHEKNEKIIKNILKEVVVEKNI